MTNYVGVDIYADNWYCMAAVVKILWELYRWLFTGTQNLSSKYDRLEEDFPFPQMSNATIQKLGRGWQRNATRFIEASNGDKCCLLATTWIDKKQIGFRNSGTIVDQKGYTTQRHVKGQRMRKEITCPQVQQEYAKYFNGVDKNDRDSSDYTVSLKTNRWYLRYYFYLIDHVIHSMYVIATNIAKQGLRDGWKKYQNKDGRYKFQIDMALALIDMGVKEDWKEGYDDENKPGWMRKHEAIPCGCNMCTFCKLGKTRPPVLAEEPTGVKKKKLRPECDDIPVKLNEDAKSAEYCRVCFYRVGRMTPKLKYNEKRKQCKKHTKGAEDVKHWCVMIAILSMSTIS
jgi:hypothetical protein